jgi:hypothetical protein
VHHSKQLMLLDGLHQDLARWAIPSVMCSREQAPIVIMSAAYKAEAIACALQVDGCLCKPLDIQDFVACVSRHRPSLQAAQ